MVGNSAAGKKRSIGVSSSSPVSQMWLSVVNKMVNTGVNRVRLAMQMVITAVKLMVELYVEICVA